MPADPTDRPDDDRSDDTPEPDAWAEKDRAYEEKWADPADEPDPLAGDPFAGDPDPFTPGPDYRPTQATPKSVSDAYVGGMSAAGPYIGLGVQIAASMALFAGGGYAADWYLGTSPWGILIGAMLGMAGIVALLVRVSREADAEVRRDKARRGGARGPGRG